MTKKLSGLGCLLLLVLTTVLLLVVSAESQRIKMIRADLTQQADVLQNSPDFSFEKVDCGAEFVDAVCHTLASPVALGITGAEIEDMQNTEGIMTYLFVDERRKQDYEINIATYLTKDHVQVEVATYEFTVPLLIKYETALELAGQGDQTTELIHAYHHQVKVTLNFSGNQRYEVPTQFAAYLTPESGAAIDTHLLINEVAESGSVEYVIPDLTGAYQVEIAGDGNWNLKVYRAI